MKIVSDVLDVLQECTVSGKTLYLPARQLANYKAVDKVLQLLGGKWNRKAKGHIFDEDPAEAIDRALLTGEVVDRQKQYQFFETPAALADKMVAMVDIQEGQSVLEPSAGRGAIVRAVQRQYPTANIQAVELDPDNIKHLTAICPTHEGDFLNFNDGSYDWIIANPPFTKQQDVKHVNHMWELLKPGGTIVTVMSVGFTFRIDKLSAQFRELADECGSWEALPEGAFKESGTMVNTALVKLTRGAA